MWRGEGARRWARWRLVVALSVIGAVLLPIHGVHGSPSRDRPGTTSPNVVLILSDDQRWDTLWAMPNLQADLVGKGVLFNQSFVTDSLCSPSRASILTGDYSH